MALHHRLLLWQKILLAILCFPLFPIYVCVYLLYLIVADLEELPKKLKQQSNLDENLHKAIKEFEANHQLVIKPADKGGNIVVMSTTQYEDMCMQILNNKNWYTRTPMSRLTRDAQEYHNLIKEALDQGVINAHTAGFLESPCLTIPTFYALPKDTGHILRILDELWVNPVATLVTLDVEALNSSIPHKKGLKAVESFLNELEITEHNHNFVLTHNLFLFKGQLYHQIQGTAMGTTCAPSFANLYLGWWERGSWAENEMSQYLCHYDSNQITFLDIEIFKDQEGHITTTLFRKETSANTILRATSSHPSYSLLKSIPYAEFIRAKRNCTTEESFDREARNIRSRLQAKGYKKSVLRTAYNKNPELSLGDLRICETGWFTATMTQIEKRNVVKLRERIDVVAVILNKRAIPNRKPWSLHKKVDSFCLCPLQGDAGDSGITVTRAKLSSIQVTEEDETSVNPETQKQEDTEILQSAQSQSNTKSTKQRKNEENLFTTYSHPWDKNNLKSIQVDKKVFEGLDIHAKTVNSSGTIEHLVTELTLNTKTELEKTRAIWIWICHHIEYDTGGIKNKALISADPDVVFHTTKGTSAGYCSLFERMCSFVCIQCKTVSGFSKGPSYKPGQTISGEADHIWNMVYLEGRWHLLDITWGAGHTDESTSKFTFQYNDFYFLTHPALFIEEHYPEEANYQLLQPMVTRKQFVQAVHHRSHFYNLGLTSSQPGSAIIETERGKASIIIESQQNMLYICCLNETEDLCLLKSMEHEARIDVYPQKTGQQFIQIYAKRPMPKEVYQLIIDYRIDCKSVDSKIRIPKYLHNPSGPSWLSERSGLLHPSHKEPIIYTEDGCCTVGFTIGKKLKLTAKLKSDEVKSISGHVIQTVQDTRIEFRVYLPQAGFFVLQIFDNTVGLFCNYLIICQNAEVKWPTFPEILQNPVGPNPQTEKAGLICPSHLEPVIQTDDGCCTFSFKFNTEQKLSCSLKSDKIQTLAKHLIQSTKEDQVKFDIRLPQYGSYVFQIFVENKVLICNYVIQCLNLKVKWPPFPSMLHNPVGPNSYSVMAGFHQPSHPDPIINTENGCFTLSFTTDRILNFTVSLKSDDVQISPSAMYILQSIQKQKLELTVHLPRSGSYVLQFFDSLAGYICNYLVTCTNPTVKWPPFPSSLHNPVGPNPETGKVGLIQPSHPDPVIHTEDGCFEVSFALMREVSIFSILHSDDVQMTPEAARRHVFQMQTQSQVLIKVRLPKPGNYVLHINIKQKNSNVYKHQCNYLITCTNAAVKWPVFPLVYTDWAESNELVLPLNGVLPENSNVFFKLQIPGVSGVRVKGKDFFPLSQSDNGYWEGTCNTANCRYMYVTISSKDNPDTWTYILQYQVGDRTP
ncbi:uncharacterized protein PAF06_007451 [Gastrophryne carolinensis]